MTKLPRRLLPPTAGRTSIERLEVENFARKLHKHMVERGMSQSDLARAAFGTTTDPRGYTVARSRDRISSYLRGASLPDPINLQKIADALGINKEELAPDLTASAVERENPELALTAIAGHSDKVLLRVNKLVPLQVAARVISMISEADRD